MDLLCNSDIPLEVFNGNLSTMIIIFNQQSLQQQNISNFSFQLFEASEFRVIFQFHLQLQRVHFSLLSHIFERYSFCLLCDPFTQNMMISKSIPDIFESTRESCQTINSKYQLVSNQNRILGCFGLFRYLEWLSTPFEITHSASPGILNKI